MARRIEHRPVLLDWACALLLGAGVALVNCWRTGRPSLLGDEAATVSIASRSPGDLWAMVTSHSDAVHGVYYAFMHAWFTLFGVDETTVRVPSAIAVGMAVAGIVMIGSTFVSRAAGLSAGVLLAALPATLMAATVGRSFALQLAFVTWLALALLLALERGRAWRWIVVGVLVTLSVTLFLYAVLVVASFGLAILLHRPWRARFLPFLIAAGIGAIPAIPIVILGYRQRNQIAWIEPIGVDIFQNVFVTQWFAGVIHAPAGYPAWLAFVTAAMFLGLSVLGFVHAWRRQGHLRGLATLAACWATVPTVALVAASLAIDPLYSPPYLTMSGPAIAVLAALGVASLRARWLQLVILAVIFASALPPFFALREKSSHRTDWDAVAEYLAANASEGDAVLVDRDPWDLPHMLFDLYPAQMDGLRDIAFAQDAAEAVSLWDVRVEPEDLEIPPSVSRIWVVSGDEGSNEWFELLDEEEFDSSTHTELEFSTLTLYERRARGDRDPG